MKKNLKKLLSLLTVLTILFTMAAIPAMAEDITVDFASAKNVAYQKVIYPIVANKWYSSGGGAPSPDNIRATDGDLTTKLNGKGANPGGLKFYIDLEKEFYIKKIVIYGASKTLKVYEGALTGAVENGVYVLRDAEGNVASAITEIPKGETQTVNGTSIGVAEYEPSGLKTQYLTFDYNDKYDCEFKEIYIEGVEVDFASEENIAYDKVVYPIVANKWYSSGGGAPSPTNKRITDGDLTTKYYAQGKKPGGVKFYIDLGAEYNLKTLKVYGCNKEMKIYKGALTGVEENGAYVLKDAEGNIASAIGSLPAGTTQSVNGINIGVSEMDLSGVRTQYLTFDYPDRYSYEIKELYIERATDPTDELFLKLLTEEEADKITKDLTLPTELESGATVSWKSSSPHIISDTGEVNRQIDDMPVTLTATMVIDGETYTKVFDLVVLKDDGNAVAWKDIFNFDFVESERESYVIQHKGGDSSYLTDPEKWEESFLPGGGYTFNNKGGEGVKMDFAEAIEEDPQASSFKVGFTMQFPAVTNSPRIFAYTRAGKYYFTAYIYGNDIGFGPSDSYVTREWYVRNVDYVSKPVTIEIIYQDGYLYPTVNGIPATRDSDGSTCFKPNNTAQLGYVGFGDFGPQNGTIFYDYYIAKRVDPTLECTYSAMTDEDPTRLTQNLFLPDSLSNGATVEWISSNDEIIEINGTVGTVTPSYYDEKVTLTACINYEGNILYKSFDFVVVAANKDERNLILDYNDFNEGAPYYVSTAPNDSSVAVKNGKLNLTRASSGELSTRKYFVTNLESKPYTVTGDKVVLEQYLTLLGDIDGGAATLYDKDSNAIATYGFKSNKAGETLFFVNAGGEEVTTRYSRGQEIFVRLEAGKESLNVLVDNEVITPTPLALAEAPMIASVKYEAGEGKDGFMSIDNLTFMLSGDDRDAMMVELDHANFTAESLTNQNPDAITSNLTLVRRSRWGSSLDYSSGNKDVLSDYGFVSRPTEDTEVPFTVIIKKGAYSKSKEFTLTVKGVDEEKNLATDNLPISSGAIEGSSDKNAIDGLDETAFVTAATEKFFAISFGKATTFNKVILKEAKNESDEYGVTGFKIEVSNDGNKWTEVETANPCTEVGDNMQVEFKQVTAKYVRYYVTELTGTQTGLREFVVIYEPDAETSLELDLQSLVIRPTDYVVAGDLTLPTVGEYGSEITWESSHPDIIADDGKLISTPEYTTTVKLTATLKNGEFTRTKDFTRSVKGTSSGNESGSGNGGGGDKPGGVADNGASNTGSGKEDPKPVDPTPADPTPVTPSANTFKDVESDRWSYDYIMELKEAGIVSGDGENFRPTDKVTREEFVKMLVLSLGITPEGTANFSDVASDAWYHDYIAVAVEKGIVNGISDIEFGIGRSISRQDMAVMTVRALTSFGAALQGGEAPVFTDEDGIADYAKEAVKVLAAAGILSGSEGKFAPVDNLTREQAAKVLCMIRKELTK